MLLQLKVNTYKHKGMIRSDYFFLLYWCWRKKTNPDFMTISQSLSRPEVDFSWDAETRLTLQVPTTQNGQTHSNNSSAKADEFFECVDHVVVLAFKALSMGSTNWCFFVYIVMAVTRKSVRNFFWTFSSDIFKFSIYYSININGSNKTVTKCFGSHSSKMFRGTLYLCWKFVRNTHSIISVLFSLYARDPLQLLLRI